MKTPIRDAPDEFIYPYQGAKKTLRVSFDVDVADSGSLNSVLVVKGALKIAMSLWFRHLAQYINDNNLDFLSSRQLYEHILERCSSSGPAKATTRTTKPRRATGLRPESKSTSDSPTDTPKRSRRADTEF